MSSPFNLARLVGKAGILFSADPGPEAPPVIPPLILRRADGKPTIQDTSPSKATEYAVKHGSAYGSRFAEARRTAMLDAVESSCPPEMAVYEALRTPAPTSGSVAVDGTVFAALGKDTAPRYAARFHIDGERVIALKQMHLPAPSWGVVITVTGVPETVPYRNLHAIVGRLSSTFKHSTSVAYAELV